MKCCLFPMSIFLVLKNRLKPFNSNISLSHLCVSLLLFYFFPPFPGASVPAQQLLRSLDLKTVQFESLSHLCLPDLQRYGLVESSKQMTDQLIRFHFDHMKDVCVWWIFCQPYLFVRCNFFNWLVRCVLFWLILSYIWFVFANRFNQSLLSLTHTPHPTF